MDSLYKKYIKEREFAECIFTDKGFVVYKIEFPNCLIMEMFVEKEHRKSKHASFLADQVFEICKQAGVKSVYCTTDDNANGIEVSKISIENFGFKPVDKNNTIATYKMEVSEWDRE